MIKIDLITGFLGAGKTTFLIEYARYLMRQGLRIGILEYDLGAINVDMLLLNRLRCDKCELEMVAAACDQDCLNRRFRTKLIAMAMSGYDRVIVEPSGVFDMDGFFDALREEPLENWYEIGSVITIVNANLDDEIGTEADYLLASQASCAGSIVLSRTQLSSAMDIARTKEHIRVASERIHCNKVCTNYVEKPWSEFTDEDYRKIMNSGYRISDYIKVTAGAESSFESVCFLDIKDNLETLKKKIELMFFDEKYGNVMRIKGFVVETGGSYQVNATRYEILTQPIAIGKNTVIVIGTGLNEELIRALINRELTNREQINGEMISEMQE